MINREVKAKQNAFLNIIKKLNIENKFKKKKIQKLMEILVCLPLSIKTFLVKIEKLTTQLS